MHNAEIWEMAQLPEKSQFRKLNTQDNAPKHWKHEVVNNLPCNFVGQLHAFHISRDCPAVPSFRDCDFSRRSSTFRISILFSQDCAPIISRNIPSTASDSSVSILFTISLQFLILKRYDEISLSRNTVLFRVSYFLYISFPFHLVKLLDSYLPNSIASTECRRFALVDTVPVVISLSRMDLNVTQPWQIIHRHFSTPCARWIFLVLLFHANNLCCFKQRIFECIHKYPHNTHWI